MIKIAHSNGSHKLFQNYHSLCDYINRVESFKELESGKVNWRFTRRQNKTLSYIYYRVPRSCEEVLTMKEKEALENGMSLIEIVKGEEENITQILLTPHLDIESLKKDWCHEYCKNHGLIISEGQLKN